MLWLNPLAAFALVGLAAPILIHLFAQRRAPRLPFPTLRFIRPVHLATVRRRALDDLALLVVRAAILAAGVAAVAGPFVLTAWRTRAWDQRLVRATVVSPAAAAVEEGTFAADRVGDGIAQALVWFARQPPGRRELLIRAPFARGSLTATEVAAVPSEIGLRFERTTALPASRVVTAPPLVGFVGAESKTPSKVERELVLDGDRTLVRERTTGEAAGASLEIVAPAGEQAAADSVLFETLRARVRAPVSGRSARIVLEAPMEREGFSRASIERRAAAWTGDAGAQIARDLADRGLGRVPVRFEVSGDRLVVHAGIHATDTGLAALIRIVSDSLAAPLAQPAAEVMPIADQQLNAWRREPGPATPARAESIDRDDRRWLWALALGLLGLETWMRRGRAADVSRPADAATEENARVA